MGSDMVLVDEHYRTMLVDEQSRDVTCRSLLHSQRSEALIWLVVTYYCAVPPHRIVARNSSYKCFQKAASCNGLGPATSASVLRTSAEPRHGAMTPLQEVVKLCQPPQGRGSSSNPSDIFLRIVLSDQLLTFGFDHLFSP